MDLGHRPGRPPCTSQLASVATVEAVRHGPGCWRSRILLLPSVQAYLELLQAAARSLRLICLHADHNASVDYSRWLSHRGWIHVYQALVTRSGGARTRSGGAPCACGPFSTCASTFFECVRAAVVAAQAG